MWPSNVNKTTTNKPKPKTTLVYLIHTHTHTHTPSFTRTHTSSVGGRHPQRLLSLKLTLVRSDGVTWTFTTRWSILTSLDFSDSTHAVILANLNAPVYRGRMHVYSIKVCRLLFINRLLQPPAVRLWKCRLPSGRLLEGRCSRLFAVHPTECRLFLSLY